MTTQNHQFSLDGFALTGVDEVGAEWTVENTSGWFSGPPVRSASENRTQQSGSWRGTVFRSGRVITLQGKVFAGSLTSLESCARRFAAVLASGGLADLVGESVTGSVLSSSVSLEDDPQFDPITDRAAVWQITVGSEDPLLYGPPVTATTTLAATSGTGRAWTRVWPRSWGVTAGTTPGAAVLPNAGTAGYFPAFRLDGPMPNPVVTVNETGEFVRYAGTVALGQWLEVDTARRRVMLNGSVDVTYLVTSSATWPSIPPGGASVSIAADAGDPAASLTAYGFEGAWT